MPPPNLPPWRIQKTDKSIQRTQQNDGDFLDRWSPQIDRHHYHRVWLHRQRKERVARQQKRRSCRNIPPQIKTQGNSGENTQPPTRPSSPRTNATCISSIVFSNLGSTFQAELDSYDDKIKSLQPGEWPSVPNPRAPILRVGNTEFHKQRARDLKKWALVEAMLYGGHSATLRDADRIQEKSKYRVGVIFSAPHHTAGSGDERWVSVSDPYQTATPYGVVHSKYRKMVVIKAFGEHCICLPIYSHNGRGLEGKQDIAEEYVDIRDVFDRRPQAPEGVYAPLLAVGGPDVRGCVVTGKSCVKLTEICSHRYDAPATIEGELDDDLSKLRVLRLFREYAAGSL
ncbi:hypothetical protein F5Y14DRAFT_443399 [Nemania sp. NC0429]|nr:hypothetical protein F5Y14DRAFT_443399 [Nemania sp. NC0429]